MICKHTVVVDRDGHVRHIRPRILQGQGRLPDDHCHLFIHVLESFFEKTYLLSFYSVVNLHDTDGHFCYLTVMIYWRIFFTLLSFFLDQCDNALVDHCQMQVARWLLSVWTNLGSRTRLILKYLFTQLRVKIG